MVRGRVLHCSLLSAAATFAVVALAPSIALASPVKRSAVARPAPRHVHRHYGGPTRSLGTHGTAPLRPRRGQAPGVSAAGAGPTNLQNLGGPVMSDVTIYNIFWVPPGDSTPNQSLINQFAEDLGGQLINLPRSTESRTSLASAARGSTPVLCPPAAASCPTGTRSCSTQTCRQRSRTPRTRMTPGWRPAVLYMVYLPAGTELCDQNNGRTYVPNKYGGNQFCAYHGAYVDSAIPSAPVIYGAMPSTGDRMDVCSIASSNTATGQGSPGPNGDTVTDSQINLASHEIFEALTDPEPAQDPAWRRGNNPADPNWRNVGYFASMTDKLDSFQLLLVQRPDAGPGDFDIVFNYDRVQWDAGGPTPVPSSRPAGATDAVDIARVGFSDGSSNSIELIGSGQEGALLDSGPNALTAQTEGSSQPGRYVFAVRNEKTPRTGGSSARSPTPPRARWPAPSCRPAPSRWSLGPASSPQPTRRATTRSPTSRPAAIR
jgi:Nidogen-like